MVTGFNLHLDEDVHCFDSYISEGESHLCEQTTKVKQTIKKYIIEGIADGTQMQKDWFPQIDVDIFLSHSHTDERLTKGLAGWLHNSFGLRCFVDSCVWGYADDLLELINSKYSDKRESLSGGYLYDYQKCNVASKHINTILTIALHKMIDKTEALFLLNTNNAISAYSDVYKDATYSPWIYSEIICSEIVRKKKISEYRDRQITLEYASNGNGTRFDGFTAAYDVSLNHLVSINFKDLVQWKDDYSNSDYQYPLDCLYKMKYKEAENISDISLFL